MKSASGKGRTSQSRQAGKSKARKPESPKARKGPSVKHRDNSGGAAGEKAASADPAPEGRERSNANLKPWVPGQSGNPKGRPKSKTISEALRELLESEGEGGKRLVDQIAQVLMDRARIGDLAAIKEVADRTEGKPRQQHQHTGPEGAPIPISIIAPVKPDRLD